MPQSYVEISASGSTNLFSFSFSYTAQSEIKAYVNGVEDTSFTFNNSQQLALSSTPTNGAVVRIERTTNLTTRAVDFQSGSVLTEADLDNSAIQVFNAAQEARDKVDGALSLANDGTMDAQSKRIKNVANPTADQDAVTKHYLENTWLSPANKTALTTVNTNISNINTLAASDVISDMNTLAVSDVISDINTLAHADVVADLNTLAHADVVSDMNTLATTAIVEDMNLLATSANITAMGNLGTTANVTNMANLNASGVISNIATVAGDTSVINSVAGKTTEIGRLGTADAVADMAILGTNDVVNDLNLLATNANVTAMGNLGTTTNVTNMANLNASGVIANIATVAGDTTEINAVAGKATEIGRLGTADAVADMAILGTTDVVNDMNLLAQADVISDMNTLASSDIIADLNTLATSDIVTDMNLLATSANVTNMATLGASGVVSDIGTVATNITNVNTLANTLSGTNAYTVTVVDSGGNKFALNGTTNPAITLKRGITYTFDQSDSSNSGHPLAFRDSSDNSYTSGVTVTGTAGQTGAKVEFAVPSNAPSSLKYYCTVHGNGMGNNITVEDDNIAVVAGISSNVTTVAGISSNVTSVAGISSNITTVANDATDIGTVAGISSNISTLAPRASDIQTLAPQATNIGTVASNISSVNDFADKYRIASSEPTSNNDEGDLYYNTTSDQLFVYTGSAWSAAALDASSALTPANNLSDLSNAATARTNLGFDGAVDTHLNTSTASSNQYLQWSGTDYQWGAVDLSAYAPLAGATFTGDVTLNNAVGLNLGSFELLQSSSSPLPQFKLGYNSSGTFYDMITSTLGNTNLNLLAASSLVLDAPLTKVKQGDLTIGTDSTLLNRGALSIYKSSNPFIGFYSGSTTRGAYLQYVGFTTDFFAFGDVGFTQTTGSFRAPLFYDSDSTSFYVNPSNISTIRALKIYPQYDTPDSSLTLYSSDNVHRWNLWTRNGDSDAFYITLNDSTSLPAMKFVYSNRQGIFYSTSGISAGIYYDKDNTTYYMNPSAQSKIYNLNLVNNLTINSNGGTAGQVLTSAGGLNQNYWSTPGGAWEEVATIDAHENNAVSSMVFTVENDYMYQFLISVQAVTNLEGFKCEYAKLVSGSPDYTTFNTYYTGYVFPSSGGITSTHNTNGSNNNPYLTYYGVLRNADSTASNMGVPLTGIYNWHQTNQRSDSGYAYTLQRNGTGWFDYMNSGGSQGEGRRGFFMHRNITTDEIVRIKFRMNAGNMFGTIKQIRSAM